MSKFNVKIDSLTDNGGVPTVQGTCDGLPFSAAPFRWGGKMLMKVVGANDFSQGQKIAIGAAAKKAVRTEGLTLPEAVLVRPRKPKAAEAVAVDSAPSADPAPEAAPVTSSTDEEAAAAFDDLEAAFAAVG